MHRFHVFPRFALPLGATSTSILLFACAELPQEPPKPASNLDRVLTAGAVLDAPATDWPSDEWWRSYADPQLNVLVAEALRESPDLAAASARVRLAQALTHISGSTLWPQVEANANATEEKQSYKYLIPEAILPKGWKDYGLATLNLQWTLDFWGKNRAALAAATSELQASRAELSQARLLLVTSVASSYAELSRLYANRDTAAKSLEIRIRTAELFTQRFSNGLETRGSVRQADSRRAAAEEALLALDEQISLQRNQLAALLGAGPQRGASIDRPTLKLDRSFGLPQSLGVQLIGRRPDIAAARLRAAAMHSRTREAKAQFYPNINLIGLIGLQSVGLNRLTDSGSDFGSVGPAVSLPIFSGGRLRGELRAAQASYSEAVANYEGTIVHAMREVADAAVSQRALGGRLAKAQEALDAATEAYRVARNRYEGGLATYLEVLTAEDNMLNSLSVVTNLRANSVLLDIALTSALGGGYQTLT